MKTRVWPGRPYPLGATWDGRGVNFALYSENATKVELCLFDSPDAEKESVRIPLPEQTDLVWHVYLPDVVPGQVYGYRVRRALQAGQGTSLQSQQGLARSLCQGDRPRDAMVGRNVGLQIGRLRRPICRSTSATTPRSRRWRSVIDEAFTWGDDRPPQNPWNKTLIYETARQGLHQAASRSAGKASAAPMPASAARPRSAI